MLGMSLAHGGHLTHGATVNFSGKLYQAVAYGLDADERIDYDAGRARWPTSTSPKMIVAGASAYSRVIDWARFREIADEVGAYLMVDMAHYAGLVAAGIYPEPRRRTPTSSRRTTHKTLRGPRGGMILATPTRDKALDSSIFPGHPGRPADARHRRQGGGLQEALQPAFKTYQQQVIANAEAWPRRSPSAGCASSPGGTDSHLFLRRPARKEHHRQGRGGGSRPRAHHRQQERDPQRSARSLS